jgi:hypothetical protein
MHNKHGNITLDFKLDGPQNCFPLLSKDSKWEQFFLFDLESISVREATDHLNKDEKNFKLH